MQYRLAISLGLAAFLAASSAFAQTGQGTTFPVQQPGVNAPGTVPMCPNSTGVMRPCDELTPLSVKVTNAAQTAYPTGATPIANGGTGTTGAVVATLAARSGQATYICGFDVTGFGGTAAIGPIVVAGTTGGSLTYTGVLQAAVPFVLTRTFTPCIPSATLATAITVTTTAAAGATAVAVNAHGFQR